MGERRHSQGSIRSSVQDIVLADFKIEDAERRAAELDTPETRVSARFVDANDHDSLVDVLKGVDVAVSALGPFYQYGVKTLRAAIDARVPYVDINDDYDSTRAAFELDVKAKEAGITAVIGLGVTPGVSNVCVGCAAEKLDMIEQINIAWVGGAGPGGDAVALHCYHALDSKIPVYIDGEYKEVSPVREPKRLVIFPEPFGPIEVSYFGHSELISLPRNINGVKNVAVWGALYPMVEQNIINKLADLELFSLNPITVNGQSVVPREFTAAYFPTIMEAGGRHQEFERDLSTLPTPGYGSLIVEVEGSKNNLPIKYTYTMNADLCDTTEWPPSIGAQMLAKGEIAQIGVLAPEQCINPELFFGELKKRGIEISEVEETTRVL